MKIILNSCTDPYFNLALEEYLLCSCSDEFFMLWRNSKSVIVGRNQNTFAEVNGDFISENGIAVVRRLTGGGAVFHDPGNINYTFIANGTQHINDFAFFCAPVIEALGRFGLEVKLSGRNDLLLDGRKISGAAQCSKSGRVLHHATLLYSADVSNMSGALNVNPLKIQSKGIKSVRSRVANISDYLDKKLSPENFMIEFFERLSLSGENEVYELSQSDIDAVSKLRNEKYSRREWNYGYTKEFSVRRETKLDCGYFDVNIQIDNGKITALRLFGDYFVNGEIADTESCFAGVDYTPDAIIEAAQKADISSALPGIDEKEFTKLLID